MCVGIGPLGLEQPWCMQGCTLGLDSGCLAREDAACSSLYDSVGSVVGSACIPMCTNDAQCPSGSVCNGESSLCSTLADPGTLPYGSPCDYTAVDACADGLCVPDDNGLGFCSAACRSGTVPQCGWSGGTSMPAMCGLFFGAAGGLADLGFCLQACNCNADCTARNPAFICNPDSTLAAYGKAGVCYLDFGLGGIPTCP
jgi:hypothetical protein